MTPELHRPIAIERVGPAGLDVTVEASAGRMRRPGAADEPAGRAGADLPCSVWNADTAGTLVAYGHLVARVVQTCVVSLEDFTATVEERFAVRCVPDGAESDDDDPEALDEIAYVDGMLDLGEAAAEQLALALDPYPRAPDAVLPDISDDTQGLPFSALASLRRRH